MTLEFKIEATLDKTLDEAKEYLEKRIEDALNTTHAGYLSKQLKSKIDNLKPGFNCLPN